MRRPIDARDLLRLQIWGVTLLVAALALVFARELRSSGDIAFVFRDATRPWITAPIPFATGVYRTPRPEHRPTRFGTRVDPRAVDDDALLFVRALRDLEVRIDGVAVDLGDRDPERWKQPTSIALGGRLAPGRSSDLGIRVLNPVGPPLLQVWSEGVDPPIVSSPAWRVGRGQRKALEAEDRVAYPGAAALPSPLGELARRAPWLLAAFALGFGLSWSRRLWSAGRSPASGVAVAWVVVGAVWSTLFAVKGLSLPRELGFDGEGHIEYVEFLAERLAIPWVTDGWMMHHPPLFYAAAAGIRGLVGAEPGTALELAALRLVPWLCGLGTILAAQQLMRRLVPERPQWQGLAVLCAGLMPVGLYMSTFVSNESTSAFFTAVVFWLAVVALTEERVAATRILALGAAAGLSMLSKSSGAIVIVVAFAFLGFRLWVVDARTLVRSAATLAAATAVAMAIGGWFYVRNWLVYGDPIAFNFDLQDEFVLWQSPGYRTSAWYAGFGQAFTAPFFSGMSSLWDGLYTSFWGDAYSGGRGGVELPNLFWNYHWMAAIYPLAAPATLLVWLGFGWLSVAAMRGEALRLRLARTFVLVATLALVASLLWMTLRYPYYGLAKASYVLGAAAPAAVAWAIGLGWVDEWLGRRGGRAAAAVLWGLHASLALAIAGAFLTW